jgi:hypothetical protein
VPAYLTEADLRYQPWSNFDHSLSFVCGMEEEAIVNKLLDLEVPRINVESFPKSKLTPIFNDAIGFSRAPISYEIKKLKQDNETILKCLRGEISATQSRTGPEPVLPMIRLSDGCWKPMRCNTDDPIASDVLSTANRNRFRANKKTIETKNYRELKYEPD